MAYLTKEEYCLRAGLRTNLLSIEVNRGKVVVREDGLIDGNNEKNILFIAKRVAKGKAPADGTAVIAPVQVKEYIPRTPVRYDDPDEEVGGLSVDANGIMELAESEKKYKHYQAMRTKLLSELAQLEIDKQMGVLVPFEAVQMLFSEHSRSLTLSVRDGVEGLLTRIGARFGLTAQESADLRKEGLTTINKANDDAIAESAKSIKNITEQYAESKKQK